jgi:hypothetical protein
MERRGNRTGNDRYEGFIPDLLREIGDITREEYEIYLSPDKKYGSQNKDGSWDGIVGEVLKRVWILISFIVDQYQALAYIINTRAGYVMVLLARS